MRRRHRHAVPEPHSAAVRDERTLPGFKVTEPGKQLQLLPNRAYISLYAQPDVRSVRFQHDNTSTEACRAMHQRSYIITLQQLVIATYVILFLTGLESLLVFTITDWHRRQIRWNSAA